MAREAAGGGQAALAGRDERQAERELRRKDAELERALGRKTYELTVRLQTWEDRGLIDGGCPAAVAVGAGFSMTNAQEGATAGPDQPPPRGAALAATDEPSPPRRPLTASEGIKLIGGLVVVCVGLVVLLAIAVAALFLVDDSSDVVAVATSAFGVIGTVVGAYFGLKIGTDGTQTAVAGMQGEAAKAQAFAAHIPPAAAAAAIADAQTLASAGPAATSQDQGGAPPASGGRPR